MHYTHMVVYQVLFHLCCKLPQEVINKLENLEKIHYFLVFLRSQFTYQYQIALTWERKGILSPKSQWHKINSSSQQDTLHGIKIIQHHEYINNFLQENYWVNSISRRAADLPINKIISKVFIGVTELQKSKRS